MADQNGDGVISGVRALLGRDRLARLVVVGSFLTLFLLAAALIALAQNNNTSGSQAAEKAFNAILPVLAGWVGTVLAYYFSSQSQEHTSQILDKTIGRVAGRAGADRVLVSEKMIPLSRIEERKEVEKIDLPAYPLAELQKSFSQKLPNGNPVTRLVFTDKDIFKYVLHVGTFNGFIVSHGQAGGSLTFASILNDQNILNQISKLVVFVSAAATLADAKAALDKVPLAQDIIVTASGNATEPMLGWLTNVDLIKALTVS